MIIRKYEVLKKVVMLFCFFTNCIYMATDAYSQSKENVLLVAAQKNDTTAIKSLIQQGVLLEGRDKDSRTPLMIATRNNNINACRILIEAGADVNALDNIHDTPFLYAGASGFTEIVALCLNNGADFKIFNRYNGTALIPACERGHIETVKEILKRKDFPIDHVNRLGWTALMEAIVLSDGGKKHITIVQLLVDAGCNVNIPDHDGVTPLAHAKKSGYKQIGDILQKAGAK